MCVCACVYVHVRANWWWWCLHYVQHPKEGRVWDHLLCNYDKLCINSSVSGFKYPVIYRRPSRPLINYHVSKLVITRCCAKVSNALLWLFVKKKKRKETSRLSFLFIADLHYRWRWVSWQPLGLQTGPLHSGFRLKNSTAIYWRNARKTLNSWAALLRRRGEKKSRLFA